MAANAAAVDLVVDDDTVMGILDTYDDEAVVVPADDDGIDSDEAVEADRNDDDGTTLELRAGEERIHPWRRMR